MTAIQEGSQTKNYQLLSKAAAVNGDGAVLEVAMGPQHPSTHGVFRMDV